jgi:lipopolysaccharide biosynthesis protein
MADTLLDQYHENVEPGPEYDDGSIAPALPGHIPVRLIAFYLPQFHAIPENDRWWGAGFTEWTNVTKALPRFGGHYQPRLPGVLGFYDLGNPEVLRRQADLARRYGIEGFCFHHYWFGGQRLLEKPLDNLLADRSIDLPFCVNWANENWTRRWDGQEQEILLGQAHSAEDDVAFARSLEPLFDDPRYIRVGGRPLLLLYRPGILPDARATVERWREHFARCGEEPLICMVQGFGDFDPRRYGMDAAIGFPPWGSPTQGEITYPAQLFDARFRGDPRSYGELAEAASEYRPTEFRYFPGVCPGWDNSPRRGNRGAIFYGSSPNIYGSWVEAAGRHSMATHKEGEQLLFINAWNEWAEGAYLEPDRHFGHAYLAATARALGRISNMPAGAGAVRIPNVVDAVAANRSNVPLIRRVARKAARILASL